MRGTVVKLKLESGYGFIRPADEREREIFFHASGVQAPLTFDGQLEFLDVLFDVSDTDSRGPRAVNVRAAR